MQTVRLQMQVRVGSAGSRIDVVRAGLLGRLHQAERHLQPAVQTGRTKAAAPHRLLARLRWGRVRSRRTAITLVNLDQRQAIANLKPEGPAPAKKKLTCNAHP